MKHLPTIDSPADLKKLSHEELIELCGEIREYLCSVIPDIGGHFASSLGAVELTVALHYLYDSPRDKLVWDVGHQAYVHKILTGRREQLKTIRRYEGISGFLKRSESEHDIFGAGHASTSISAALGVAIARDLKGEGSQVVAVIGDGGMTGGLAYEALNNAGGMKTDITVVLNDNRMSISPNVGAISRYLAGIITDPLYNRIKGEVWNVLGLGPFPDTVRGVARRFEESLKHMLAPGLLFEELGFKYIGPIDGHSLDDLIPILRKARELPKPLLVHVITTKGYGHAPAEEDPVKYHGVKPAKKKIETPVGDITVGETPVPSYQDVFGEQLLKLARRDPRICAITAAMSDGTGLNPFRDELPKRFFDVGIAEGHAVTFAAGLATEGYVPVCGIYSTFLQRAFDHIMHDVTLQKLPVVFCLDRAGLAGEDGATHHGVFDLVYLSTLPNMIVAAPKDGTELKNLLFTAVAHREGAFAIRYPKDASWVYDPAEQYTPIPIGTWEVVREGTDGAILAVGSMVKVALETAERLVEHDRNWEVINCRFVKPLDNPMLSRICTEHSRIVTLEEGAIRGGFGDAVRGHVESTSQQGPTVESIGLPDRYMPHGPRGVLLDLAGLSPARIERQILGDSFAQTESVPHRATRTDTQPPRRTARRASGHTTHPD